MPLKANKKSASNLFELDGPAWAEGYTRVDGVDEAGRGPLFGPVVAAAVIFEPRVRLRGLNDSKQLTEESREQLFDKIHERALAVGVGMASVEEIAELNIYHASHLAAQRAVEQLSTQPDYLVTDMLKLSEVGIPFRAEPKADGRSHAVAAASVVAKVIRDRMLARYDLDFPGYGLAQHKGYPTAQHRKALAELGVTTQHRTDFSPVAQIIAQHSEERSRSFSKITSLIYRRIKEGIESNNLMEWEMNRGELQDYLAASEWQHLEQLATLRGIQ
jgi:ribonuclease HII